MIFITGDVHDKIKNSWEQDGSDDFEAAERYLDILLKNGLKATLFINGICADKNPEKIKEISKMAGIEIGGHTYDNFGGIGLFKGYANRKIFGCIYGLPSYQKKDIQKTKKAFEKTGIDIKSWRTHAFASNEETFRILREKGITYVSDLLGDQRPFEKSGIMHMPINIPVDQNTLAYGELKPENRDSFASCTKGRIMPEEWFDILKKRVTENERKGIPSIILIHPQTMKKLDNFRLFEKTAKFLSKYKSKKISDFKN